jgi:DMSO/TMAO reductase YedYZ molybdopterin-dependent catalytic subunit
MPSETRVAILECAGNSRVFLVPQVEGAQWELGAVGNAQWTGVPLGVRSPANAANSPIFPENAGN